MPRAISILGLVLACITIAMGRTMIRRARRSAAGGTADRRQRAMGWMMLGAGTLLMIAAVAGW